MLHAKIGGFASRDNAQEVLGVEQAALTPFASCDDARRRRRLAISCPRRAWLERQRTRPDASGFLCATPLHGVTQPAVERTNGVRVRGALVASSGLAGLVPTHRRADIAGKAILELSQRPNGGGPSADDVVKRGLGDRLRARSNGDIAF